MPYDSGMKPRAPDATLHKTGDVGTAHLRALIDSTGLTQAEVAERIGVDARTMRRYLSPKYGGASYPVQFAIERLASDLARKKP